MGRVAAVGKVDLPYVKPERDRNGSIRYWYFRRDGRRWKLPGDPGSSEFMAEYSRLLAETDQKARVNLPDQAVNRTDYPRGSFGRLVVDFLASGQFRDCKPRTQAEYRRICEALSAEYGNKRVGKIRRRHVRRMRDARAETPGAANTIVRMMKLLLNFAVDDELIPSNPAARMKLLAVGEWRAWSDEECAKFEARWPPGSMQRRAYCLALYTGQRLSDQVTRKREHRRDGGIYVVQSKTDEPLWIPEHRELTAELGRGVGVLDTLLVTPTTGKPFDPIYYGTWMADAIEDADLPDDVVLHGLRKTAAKRLADLGLSEETIKSITGHITSAMVQKYVKGANQKRLAKQAMRAWENDGNTE
jgi:integrase